MKIPASLRLSRILITFTLLFLVYITYLFYARLQSLIDYSNKVDETNKLKYKMEECFSYLKDAEIGQRGFLLTKDSLFLEPLKLANIKIYPALNELSTYEKTAPEYIFLINDFI